MAPTRTRAEVFRQRADPRRTRPQAPGRNRPGAFRHDGTGGQQMVIVMAPEATASDIDSIVSVVRGVGGEEFVRRGVSRTIIGLIGDITQFGTLSLRGRPGVSDVIRDSVPHTLV